jgi:small subunit ribosomal protein S27Ae
MADEKAEKPKEEKKAKAKKGKKPHKNKPTGKKYLHYAVSGSQVTRGKSCPRCGVSVFLAKHKGRLHCGKCNYTEFGKN